MFPVLRYVAVSSTVQGLLMAAALFWTGRNGRSSSRLLAGLLLDLSLLLVCHVATGIALPPAMDLVARLGVNLTFLLGPLLYTYLASVLLSDWRLHARAAWHAVPFFLFSGIALAHHLSPDTAGWPVLDGFAVREGAALVHLAGYLVYAGLSLGLPQRLRADQAPVLGAPRLRWLRFLTLSFVMVCLFRTLSLLFVLGLLPGDFWCGWLAGAIWMTFFLFFNTLLFVGLSVPNLFTQHRKYERSPLGEARRHRYLARLRDVMRDEKPYLDPGLSLASLAERVDVPPRHLSRLLNAEYGQSFYDFISRFRVDEASALLCDPATRELSILEIAQRAGFASKPTFNAAFKKRTGRTPSQVRSTEATADRPPGPATDDPQEA